jgi:hypothetical protein
MSSSSNNVSSTKDNVTDEVVVISSANNNAYGVLMSPAGMNQTAYSVERTAITDPPLKVIEDLALYWLNADCVQPDFCDGIDMNRDSFVNLLDYALLMNIE